MSDCLKSLIHSESWWRLVIWPCSGSFPPSTAVDRAGAEGEGDAGHAGVRRLHRHRRARTPGQRWRAGRCTCAAARRGREGCRAAR